MTQQPSRRRFLQTAAAGAAVGLGEWAKLLPISPATADEAKVTPDLIRFSPDLEPVVRLIEETPTEKCIAVALEQLRKGLPYRQFLAALYLAQLRVGIVFHPLGALHSANELTLDLPVQERLLPAFWALYNYKVQNLVPGSSSAPWLKPLTGKLPAAADAEKELHAAMKAFDADRSERAIAALIRAGSLSRATEAQRGRPNNCSASAAGKTIRLSEFRGRPSVVLVFLQHTE
jgi:hypothetical protein